MIHFIWSRYSHSLLSSDWPPMMKREVRASSFLPPHIEHLPYCIPGFSDALPGNPATTREGKRMGREKTTHCPVAVHHIPTTPKYQVQWGVYVCNPHRCVLSILLFLYFGFILFAFFPASFSRIINYNCLKICLDQV